MSPLQTNDIKTTDIQKEHAIETYKSLVQISIEGVKLLAILNGGAAVAILTYLGNIAGKCLVMPDMRQPMACFLGGLVLSSLCFVASYLTQLSLFNVSLRGPASCFYKKPEFWLPVAMIFVIFSIVAFAWGSGTAVVLFR